MRDYQKENWIVLAEKQKIRQLLPALQRMPSVDIAEALEQLEESTILDAFDHFDSEAQAKIFGHFEIARQLNFFQHISKKRFAPIFENMASDDRCDLFQHMSQDEQAAILPYLSKEAREDVVRLSSYPPETAGGIMSTDFATIMASMSVESAIAKVRRDSPSKKMIYYIYVVDNRMKMVGFVSLKDLIMASPNQLISNILHEQFISTNVDEDREIVAKKIEDYDLLAIPVLNSARQLVGIVTQDDAIEVIRAEHTEDMEKFMGIMTESAEHDYMQQSSMDHFRKRVVWIVSLAAIGIISGMIIHKFESTLEALIILALYMPMVADTGGNSGSQAATVIVRALALGQISPRQWFNIIFKEFKISSMLAVCLGVLAFLKVLFLSWETSIPAEYTLVQLAVVISTALSLQVITATCIGAGLPLLVKRFGGDPAVAASPAITTVVDITGLLIYFTVTVTLLGL
ncbi:magnesium transporter [Belliella kenyensis]|uniref:Magnesium transporter MgtE n=1 Tax=Belliella kenyensis TaxID=1472724 RepID=A0ABV8ER21_9BACT|nr:magnesium transporter [Belliella kenyensis]MCH7401529.1 magnesium transporter [Belliella kenyensis]MDN3603191.1 magnesium transporter [Belliella kenyensis]